MAPHSRYQEDLSSPSPQAGHCFGNDFHQVRNSPAAHRQRHLFAPDPLQAGEVLNGCTNRLGHMFQAVAFDSLLHMDHSRQLYLGQKRLIIAHPTPPF